jgi:class 3 adenylate cyclase/ketosteroid isomerase-like protein
LFLCPSCGAELLASLRFCDSCGASVVAPDALAEGARKVVTAVFADLVGSTALQEALDAESVLRVMDRFYEAMRGVIESQDGRVEKFIGDAVVAVFGVPSVREDDALRAVRAAAEMSAALGELNEELERVWGVRLAMRVGVNTGELVVREEGILVGDTMNTAARLEQAAGAGEVLVGRATWRLVHHAVELEPVTALELKGKAGRARAWRLVSASRAEGPPAEAPLVGRVGELERLRSALDDAVSGRACRLVSVIGLPGVGKTRLARELGRTVGDQARLIMGRCEPTGEGITFLPVAEVLRTVAGIGEADPADTVRAKLRALAPEDDPDRDRLVEGIAGVLGVAESSSAQETFWALRRGVENLARERPLVLVLDDLHWGQPMLLDLVEHLVEWVHDAPVLIIALARPELRETRDALAVAGRRLADVIELGPLDQGESRELVSGLLGEVELPPALSARILATTEGNPLFLGETMRMLVDEGVLRRDGDAWVAADDLGTVDVPPTIQALLAARLERLRADERSVVESAAVIGKQFYRGAVAELVAPPVGVGIDGHLDALRRKDMVEPEGSYWIDEPVYRFHHILVRDAAYRSLLKEARAALHERFADWLVHKAGELVGEHEEVIAFHLEQAHEYRRQLGPLDERGRALGVRAAERLHSAGRRALAREDLAAAANLLGRALARETRADVEILWDLCEAVLSAGDTGAGGPLVDRLAAEAGDDPRHRARAEILAAQLANLTGAGHVEATIESAAAAAATLRELGDRAGEAKACHVSAEANARLGQVAAVETALDRALAAAREADDPRRITAVLAGAPRAALWGPSPVVRASGRCLDVVRIVRMTRGNPHVEAIALRCQAVLEAMRGRMVAAREILVAGRATLEELGLALELNETAVHAGIVELLAGDPVMAAGHLRAARDGFEALGVASGAAQAAALLARALIEQGGSDAEALEQTIFAEEHGGEDLKTTITWSSVRAEALARTGDFEQALTYARHAVALADPTDALADKADASMSLARVLLAAGQDAEAREAAAAASAWYAAKGHAVGVGWAARLAGERAAPVAEQVPATRGAAPSVLAERPPWRFHAAIKRRFDAHDLDALLQLYAEDYVMIDHRSLGWEELRGHAPLREVFESGFAMAPDMRLEVDEVLACDDRVIAMRIAFRGHASDGAGELEISVGYVSVFADDRWLRDEQYEYEDDTRMLARYAALGGQL